MSFIKNIIYFVLTLQERILTQRLNKTLGAKRLSKRKSYYASGCFLSLDSMADSEKQTLEEELKLILKTHNYDPKEILNYIKNHNTKVFYIENPKYLHAISQNEGFIYPQKGTKALYLSILTGQKPQLKTSEMFILSRGEINKYYFIYNFYNWYAFKHNIAGLDSESQELLNKFLFTADESEFSKLQLADIYKLKDAIKQDKASIEFVFKLCRDFDGARNALNKIKDSGANL